MIIRKMEIALIAPWICLSLGMQMLSGQVLAAAETARPALSVALISPQAKTLNRVLNINGSIAAWKEASICSDISGLRLVDIKVQVGDAVKKGQILAVLDDERLQAEAEQGRAQLAEAEANVADAQANAQRARAVAGSGAFSEQQVNQYLTAEKTAQARLQSAKANLANQLLRLKHTKLLANDDGVITLDKATLGAAPAEGQELFRLVRQWRLEWRGELTADELLQVQPGMAVSVQVAGSVPVAGKIRALAPSLDQQNRNALLYADLADAYRVGLRPGMFARGEVQLGVKQGLVIPGDAIVLRDGFSYVFRIVQQQGELAQVRQVKVALGNRSEQQVEVIGVQANDQLVASGGSFLADGDWVKVVKP